ncbi:MAG: serine protease [Sulfurovum sp.]|nr:serine protease [Sulfurovum sp.]
MFKNIFITSLIGSCILWASSEIKIINGTEVAASNEEWQTIVALKWQDSPYCAGTLIAPTWVLTAAHCLVDSSNNVYEVASGDTIEVGSYNINTMIVYRPKRFIVHGSYNPSLSDHDIGLIELTTAVTQVSPIAYDTSHSLASDTQTKVAGWGNMSTIGTVVPTQLMEALVPIVSTSLCNSSISYNGAITDNMLCAGYMQSTRDSCQGDSGGPLIVDNTLVGIVSWGKGCAQDNFPGVYAKVQNYESWIKGYTPYKVINEDKNLAKALVPIISILLGK